MIVYEVNVEVERELRDDYLAWLRPHIDEICALDGFTGASCFELREPPPSAGRVGFCVQYRLVDAAALEAYLRDHAPRLRADGVARFGDRFSANRRVLASLPL
ncbi:DUF4286 family protein [Lysobacter korlensis]|uniref:DUF4286 family protein n=1 Tax=Lysobacter korlensis TaxID=553636 RepID=A0ABV6RHY3_9GAMM